jgi:vitamin B12 transporter
MNIKLFHAPEPSRFIRKYASRALVGCAVFATFSLSTAQEQQAPTELPPMTITATRTDALVESLGQSVIVLDQEKIQLAKQAYVTDILQEQPGIYYYSFGTRASQPVISLRGMRHYHTKLLIDGVPYLDNSTSAGNSPLFDNLSLSLIDRIEIVKGAVSLQGSSAMGGVVNVITKKPTEEGTHGVVNLEAGSHARVDTSALLFGKYGIADFKIGLARQSERGISAYRKGKSAYMNINGDDDGFRSMNYLGQIGLQLDEHWRAEIAGSFTDTDEEYDSGDYDEMTYAPIDTDDIFIRRTAGHAKIIGSELLDGLMDVQVTYAKSRSDRIYENIAKKSWSAAAYRYKGDMDLINAQAKINLNERNAITLGIDYQEDHVRGWMMGQKKYKAWDETTYATGYYLAYQTEPIDNLFFNANLRFNDHSDFDHEWTGDVSASYLVEPTGTTFKAAIGKGYRAPNPYELMPLANNAWFWRGNPDLEPETAITWNVGINQQIIENVLDAEVTYFQNQVDDFIDGYGGYDESTWFSYPTNIDKLKIRGVEAAINAYPFKELSLKLAYTWQHVRDTETGNKHIAFIPDHQITFDANYNPITPLFLNLGGAFIGSRYNASLKGKMDNYCLVHSTVTWKFNDNLKAYVRIDNLLNENYATYDSFGVIYNTYGRTYYAGLTYAF